MKLVAAQPVPSHVRVTNVAPQSHSNARWTNKQVRTNESHSCALESRGTNKDGPGSAANAQPGPTTANGGQMVLPDSIVPLPTSVTPSRRT